MGIPIKSAYEYGSLLFCALHVPVLLALLGGLVERNYPNTDLAAPQVSQAAVGAA